MLWTKLKQREEVMTVMVNCGLTIHQTALGREPLGTKRYSGRLAHLKYSYNQEIGHEVSTTASSKLVIVRL